MSLPWKTVFHLFLCLKSGLDKAPEVLHHVGGKALEMTSPLLQGPQINT